MTRKRIITLFFVILGVTVSAFAQDQISDTSVETEVSDMDVIGQAEEVVEIESVDAEVEVADTPVVEVVEVAEATELEVAEVPEVVVAEVEVPAVAVEATEVAEVAAVVDTATDTEVNAGTEELAEELSKIKVKSVSNVRVSVNSSQFIDIMYDLSEESNVSIYFSSDNGATFYGPIYAISGDLGQKIPAGKDKSVSWNIKSELGEINVSEARIKIVAKRVKPRVDWTNMFLFGATLDYPTADVPLTAMPYSFMYGGYRRAGIYARFAMDFEKPEAQSVSNANMVFYDGTGTQSLKTASFGLLFRLGNFGALGFGATGAMRTLYATTTSEEIVEYANDMWAGGEVSLIINIKFISLGVTGIYFENMTAINAGIGINF